MILEPSTALQIAKLLNASLIGADLPISGVCTLDNPKPHALGFARTLTPEQAGWLTGTTCLFLVAPALANAFPAAHIPVEDPRRAFAQAVTHMLPPSTEPPIHPLAVVHPSARIGEGTIIRAHAVIGPSVIIGKNCVVKSCAVIGQEGLGIVQEEDGDNLRIPHLGGVVIGDDVEIGASSTICAGTIEPTIIENNVKCDDHVFVAHNVHVGENSILVACAEISGSVSIGPRSWLGPNCSILNGLSLGRGVFVGMGAVVIKSLPDRAVAAGSPARILRIAEQDGVPLPKRS